MRFSLGHCLIPVCAVLLIGSTPARSAELPEVDGSPIVARVNGEPITLDRFLSELRALHAGMEMGGSQRPRQKPSELLDRLINTRLLLQEATVIGLDQLPQVQDPVAIYRDQALAAVLLRHALRDLELDQAEVDRNVRERVRELTLESVRFTEEAFAKELIVGVESGGDFRELAQRMDDDGKVAALELNDPEFIKVIKLLPQIYRATTTMELGQLSAPVAVEDSFVVFVISDARYPDDPELRETVEREIWGIQKATATNEYIDSLIDLHARTDEDLFETLDFEAQEPGFDTLLKDERVLVEIAGERSVTVGRYAQDIKGKFLHGMESAIKSRKVNSVKREVLYDLLRKRVVLTEARRLDLDESAEYLQMVAEYHDRMLFGLFVKKVVDPDVRLDDKTMEEYLSRHVDEYTTPEMMRIDGLAFGSKEAAENALARLNGGADVDWMRRNGEGRLGDDRDLLKLHGDLTSTAELPADARNAVSGANGGEYRFCALTDGPFYVLRVVEVIPSRPQALSEVYRQIAPKVLGEQRTKLIEDWAAKLREVSEVEVFASADDLRRIIGLPKAGSS